MDRRFQLTVLVYLPHKRLCFNRIAVGAREHSEGRLCLRPPFCLLGVQLDLTYLESRESLEGLVAPTQALLALEIKVGTVALPARFVLAQTKEFPRAEPASKGLYSR
jgi:hypothetical protein